MEELEQIEEITSNLSVVGMVGPAIPEDMLPDTLRTKLQSEHYDRMVLSVAADYEGDETFALVERIRNVAQSYYPDTCYLAGQGVSTYDLMDTITSDMVKINIVAIGAVFVVLLLSMRSLILPVVLVLTIETVIWLNLSIPYMTGDPIFYIAYLIISSIQLRATVDYAILFADRYKENRMTRAVDKKQAVAETVSGVTVSVLTSGMMLISAGFLLGAISSHGLLSQLGFLLGKGTICSLFAVLFVLPGFLYMADRIVIRKGEE